jgi:uroporphyrinogen decarboxylase
MEKSKEGMNSKERWKALLSRQPIDRVPFMPFGCFAFSCCNVGYTTLDVYTDMQKSFEAQRKTAEQYDYFPFSYVGIGPYGVWEFGGKIRMPSTEYEMAPIVVRHPVLSEEDVSNLKRPDVKAAGTIPNNMALSKLQETVSDIPIVPVVPGVLTITGNIIGPENLARWVLKKPKIVHKILEMVSEHFIDIMKYWVESFDPDRIILYCPAAYESNQIIAPKHFEEFVLPYQKSVNEKVLSMGVKHIMIHICGEHNLNLPFWSQIPAGDPGILTFGHEVDLETAIKYFPEDIIVGNVEPAILQTGRGEKVYNLSRTCIEKGKKAPSGYMLGAGCTISPLTPSYNFWSMQKALNDFGWYE